MKNWEIIEEMNDDANQPTCWAKEINNQEYGKFVWITINPRGKYDVEVEIENVLVTVKTLKTLSGAKKWVDKNI